MTTPLKTWFVNKAGNPCFGQDQYPMFEIVPRGKCEFMVKYWGCDIHRCKSLDEGKEYIENYLKENS